jgi:hypothetical protein
VRAVLILAAVILTGCDYGFTFHPEQMTPDQMVERADLVFIGVIEGQHLDSWPFFVAPGSGGEGKNYWRPLRRRVRVETVVKGSNPGPEIDIYEIFWTGGATGNWNSTQESKRYLFMVRRESGRWHITRDYWRSIYQVRSGYHARLPFDESRNLWERYALMNYWIGADQDGSLLGIGDALFRANPGQKLGWWRQVKLLRGLLKHPLRGTRQMAKSNSPQTNCSCVENLIGPYLRKPSLRMTRDIRQPTWNCCVCIPPSIVPSSVASFARNSWRNFRTIPITAVLPISLLPRPSLRITETFRS